MTETIVIERRFRGPSASGNGGFSCGVLGVRVPGAAQVTLRAPPPLDTAMALVAAAGRLELRHGERLIAEALPSAKQVAVPEPVGVDAAAAAARGYAWFTGHPYPQCFVCGPERAPGDGLRIFPGAVHGRELAAAPWSPDRSLAGEDGRVRAEIVWAALDCPSWFGYHVLRPDWRGAILLGRLDARVRDRPRVGDTCVALGWPLSTDGRKIRCGSALLAADGRVLASAEATWIELR